MTPLKTLARRKRDREDAEARYRLAIREAVAAGIPKIDVAKAAGISRPTLDKILARP